VRERGAAPLPPSPLLQGTSWAGARQPGAQWLTRCCLP
jgi:hypothetical protein